MLWNPWISIPIEVIDRISSEAKSRDKKKITIFVRLMTLYEMEINEINYLPMQSFRAFLLQHRCNRAKILELEPFHQRDDDSSFVECADNHLSIVKYTYKV